MNKILLAFLLSSSLVACTSTGIEFMILVPDHPDGGPKLTEITWWTDAGVPTEKLSAAAGEWTRALECGANFKRTDNPKFADIKFVCGPLDKGISKVDPLGTENGYFATSINKAGVTVVVLDEWCSDNIARVQALHVWGHALGYPHQWDQSDSVLASAPIYPLNSERASLGIRGEELDNIRIWAYKQGAPGCNEKELPWSWEIYPDFYSSYPDVSSFPLTQNQ